MSQSQSRGHYAAPNPTGAPTLPSIGSLISGADMTTPVAPNVAYHNHYHGQQNAPKSPLTAHRSKVPQAYGPPSSETRPPTGYSVQEQSVSPTISGPEIYRRYSVASKDRFPAAPVEQAQYPTPQSPRRTSFAHPNSAWPTTIPQNYTFSSQPFSQVAHTSYTHTSYDQAHPPHQVASSPRFAPQHTQSASASYWKTENTESQSKPTGSFEQPRRLVGEFDLLDTLNHIRESNKQIGEFAVHYSERALATQRTGPLPGSTPNLMEIDRMIHHHNDVQHNLFRMRDVIVEQQAILAEHSREQMQKHALTSGPKNAYAHDHQQDQNPNSQPDSKKRRGRAAPPGRCHSCARSETPEWRRGPDGARTLCNACGLRK